MSESSFPLLIGVDGGGTSCRAALLRQEHRFEITLGSANVATDFEGATATIREAITALAAKAGMEVGEVSNASTHVGLAGVMSPTIAKRVAHALQLGHVVVTDDQPTTVAGALGIQDGAVAAIGTGSFIGRQVRGQISSLGGWGFRLGDQAAGAWLIRRSFEELMLAIDGLRPMTDFAQVLLDEYDGDPGDLVHFSLTATPADYGRLARHLIEAAKAGDILAMELMTEGADYIRRGLQQLGWTRGEPLCFTGGLGPAYADWLGIEAATPLGTALDGALVLAGRQQEGAA